MTDINFSSLAIEQNLSRLTNQVWKLIPMRENNENWLIQLNTVIIEIEGLKEIFFNEPLFLCLLAKLIGLQQNEEIAFTLYRKTIFEVISLLQEIKQCLTQPVL